MYAFCGVFVVCIAVLAVLLRDLAQNTGDPAPLTPEQRTQLRELHANQETAWVTALWQPPSAALEHMLGHCGLVEGARVLVVSADDAGFLEQLMDQVKPTKTDALQVSRAVAARVSRQFDGDVSLSVIHVSDTMDWMAAAAAGNVSCQSVSEYSTGCEYDGVILGTELEWRTPAGAEELLRATAPLVGPAGRVCSLQLVGNDDPGWFHGAVEKAYDALYQLCPMCVGGRKKRARGEILSDAEGLQGILEGDPAYVDTTFATYEAVTWAKVAQEEGSPKSAKLRQALEAVRVPLPAEGEQPSEQWLPVVLEALAQEEAFARQLVVEWVEGASASSLRELLLLRAARAPQEDTILVLKEVLQGVNDITLIQEMRMWVKELGEDQLRAFLSPDMSAIDLDDAKSYISGTLSMVAEDNSDPMVWNMVQSYQESLESASREELLKIWDEISKKLIIPASELSKGDLIEDALAEVEAWPREDMVAALLMDYGTAEPAHLLEILHNSLQLLPRGRLRSRAVAAAQECQFSDLLGFLQLRVLPSLWA
mmetsp:Transcript_50477/g.108104  ORF Transcript_50477/g.108104 Transcript_50477/m.108104 type:complete len:539 (+) Transcript_50477:49-1665(+)